jgi:hypothetical protein
MTATHIPASPASDRVRVVPKKIREWRKKKYKQGKDVYNTCHTCCQVFNCGHMYNTLCYECDLSWDRGRAMACPLWVIRKSGGWLPNRFVLYQSEGCQICHTPTYAHGAEEARVRWTRSDTHAQIWHWLKSRTAQETQLTFERLMKLELEYILRQWEYRLNTLDVHTRQQERDVVYQVFSVQPSWSECATRRYDSYFQEHWCSDGDLLPWQEQIFQFRDFRRRS